MSCTVLDYKTYTEAYAAVRVPEDDFGRLYVTALAEIEAMSFGRISGDMDETVQRAACILAEGLYTSGQVGAIASESNDGFSQSYQKPGEIEKEARHKARMLLAGRGLLYAGVGKCL